MEPLVVRLSDSVTIIHADCRDVLPMECDAVVTDPPYGIYACGGKWGHKADLQWDKEAADVLHLLDLAECVAIWGGNYFPLPPSRGWLSWFKPDRVPSAADIELCWTSRDMNARQISHSIAATNAERVGHPTQKPVRVMVWCMEQARVPDGALVLDPFAGSGSTGVACIRTGRRFVGIERDAGRDAHPPYMDPSTGMLRTWQEDGDPRFARVRPCCSGDTYSFGKDNEVVWFSVYDGPHWIRATMADGETVLDSRRYFGSLAEALGLTA